MLRGRVVREFDLYDEIQRVSLEHCAKELGLGGILVD